MKNLLFIVFLVLFPVILFAQVDVAPIPGWTTENLNGQNKFTPPAGNLEYDVMPAQKAQTDNLTEWVKALVPNDLKVSGYSAPLSSTPPVAKFVQSAFTYTVAVTDNQTKKWGITYIAYKRPDNAIRYARVIWQPGKSSGTLSTAVRHFAALMKQETGQIKNQTTAAKAAQINHDANKGDSKSVSASPVTAPGKGLAAADIRGVVIHGETGMGVGGIATVFYNPYLLLKDGSIYEHPEISPYDLDVAASKRQEPEKWGTWKIEGKVLLVNHGSKNGVEKKVDRWTSGWWYWAVPAKPNETLNATFNSLTGGGNAGLGGGSITVSSSDMSFNPKGQFTNESMAGGSYSGSGAGVSAYSNKNKAGVYKLNGFSIELKYNNGTGKRQIFYFVDDEKRSLGIGNRTYVITK